MAVKARPLRIWSLRQQISERRLIEAAEILAADLSEDEQVAALRHRGFGEGDDVMLKLRDRIVTHSGHQSNLVID